VGPTIVAPAAIASPAGTWVPLAMLSDEQLAEFDRAGFVRLPAIVPEGDCARIRESLWSALAAHGIARGDRATWTVVQPRHLQALRRAGALDAIAPPALSGAIDDLLGPGAWERPRHWGEPLVSFPVPGEAWRLPRSVWHIDWPAHGAARPPFGVKVLACAADVVPLGGGTLVVAGSHRLVSRFLAERPRTAPVGSRKMRGALVRSYDWFRDLCSDSGSNGAVADRAERFMSESAVLDGVAVRVVELTGAAGDVVLFHPWLFHAPSQNCAREPRLVIGHNVQTPRALAVYAGKPLP